MEIFVNNIKINYEVFGSGEPMICLHGNTEDLTIYDELSKLLKNHFKVYLVDSRNHGKSGSGTFSYDQMANDIVGFIQALNITKPHIIGFSDGAIIAKLVAIKHPSLCASLVLLGGNYRPDGLKHEILKSIKEKFRNTKNRYDGMMLNGPYIKKSELRSICIPTLLVFGSNDGITKKHISLMKKMIKNSKLLIMQNKNHDDYIVHKTDLYEPLMVYYRDIHVLKSNDI